MLSLIHISSIGMGNLCDVSHQPTVEKQREHPQKIEQMIQPPVLSTPTTPAHSPSSVHCPNDHSAKWVENFPGTTNHKCTKCSRVQNGFYCSLDKWFLCDSCNITKFGPKKCPNGHSSKWVENFPGTTNHKCTKCSRVTNGWFCSLDHYFFCDSCGMTMFEKAKCPNEHKTSYIQNAPGTTNHKCAKCSRARNGMWCSLCHYILCESCAG